MGQKNIPSLGSAITTSKGRPLGDHLSTQKNCSPVRERSLGPSADEREENKEG